MKKPKLLAFVAFIVLSMLSNAQTTYTAENMGSPCPFDVTEDCPNPNTAYHGGVIQMHKTNITGSDISLEVSKCNNGSFTSPGTMSITEDGFCNVVATISVQPGTSIVSFVYHATHTSGTVYLRAIFYSDSSELYYHTGIVKVTAHCSGDSYEPNDTYNNANTTMFPNTLSCQNSSSGFKYATIHEMGDVDYYKVNYSNFGTFDISLVQLPVNYDLEIVSPLGITLLSSNNSGTSSEFLSYSPSSLSNYNYFFVKVKGVNNSNNCDTYTLHYEWTGGTPNAPILQTPSNQSTFTPPPGAITYNWSKNGNVNSATYELKIRDLTISTNILNYQNVGNVNSYTHNYNYVAGHRYQWTVRAKDDCGNYAEGGFYTFDVQAPANYNLSLGSPQSFGTSNLTVGQTYNYTTSIQNTGNANWSGSIYLIINNSPYPLNLGSYAINHGSSEYISYNFTPNANHVGINVPVRIVYQTGGNGSSQLVPPGNYTNPIYVNIQNVQGPCPDSYEANNTVGTATTGVFQTLGNSNYVNGIGNANIHVDTDVDYYKISFSESGNFSATISNLPADYALELVDNSDNSFDSSQAPGNGDETVNYTFFGSGSFYIKVYSANAAASSCTNYTLSINWIPNTPAACPDQYESNNSKSTANVSAFSSILGNNNYSHSITDANIDENGDIDYYKVNYNANGTVTVNLTNLPQNYDLEILDENMNLDASNATGTTSEVVSYNFSGSGYFYIKVYNFGGNVSSCSPYTLSLNWVVNTSGPCSYFSDLPQTETDAYNAASCLCSLGYITPQDYNNDGTADEVNPNANIYRADLAKMVFFALYEGDNPAYSDPFPVPFVDLQQSGSSYYRYAKALSYLEYGDGVSPFSRDFRNFRPYDGISKKYVLKVMLEAFNIPPDNSGPSPFPAEINPGDDAYGYVKEAYDRGYITEGNVHDLLPRKYAFIVLHRILSDQANQGCSGDCDMSCHPNINDSDYFLPGNLTPYNLSRGVAMDEGFFNYTSPTGFYIPGFNLSLAFSHSYNQVLVELPRNYTQYKTVTGYSTSVVPLRPLGIGWTHTYNSYIMKIPGWNVNGEQVSQKVMVFWPGGNIHFYNDATKQPETHGVFDEMTQVSNTVIEIKKKNQMVFTFTRFDSDPTHPYYLTKIEDRNNNTISIVYEAKNGGHRIKEVVGTAGRKLKFYYQSGTNYLNRVLDQAGNRNLYFTVNTNQENLTNYTNPRGKATNYNYDIPANHLLTSITLPRGNVITNHYAANNKLDWTKLASGGQSITNTFTHNYNFGSSNNFLSTTTTDQEGTVTNTDYNSNGYTKKVEIDNAQILYDYNNSNLPSLPTHIDYEGFGSNMVYDNKGNVTKITLPGNVEHEYHYNSLNDIVWYEDPKNHRTHFYYDGNNNLDYIEDNMGFVTDFTIDNRGQVTSVKNPENITTTFSYDSYGNRTDVNAPLGIHSHFNFDNVGRMTQSKDPLNFVTSYLYDAHNQVKKITQGSVVTEYSYDDNDNLIWVKNAKGYKTTMTYDDRDFVHTSSFGNDTKTYTYRNDGLLDTYQKPDGYMFGYDYDNLGRVISDGITTFTYWGNKDLVKTVTKNGHTLTFYYDALDRLDQCTDYFGNTVSYSYDSNGNITGITYPDGFYVDYVYDANNRLTQVKWDSGSKTTTYTYYDDGRLKKATNPNGTFTDYSYDAAGRMTGLTNKKSNGTVIASYTFTLDKRGNHLTENVTEPLGIPTLPAINLTNTYNSENEITNSGFAFDSNGNRTSKPNSTSTWDHYDMMTSKDGTNYEYDGIGLRRKVTKNGVTTKYVWDVQGIGNILMDMDNNGNAQHYYIHGLGLIARKTVSNSNTHYYHYDFRGSTVAMTDASGNITHKYKYAPFGAITDKVEADDNPFTFVGKYGVMNEGNSTYYMRARYMDALTGRFLSEDPVWDNNLFPYAGNNPINYFDPYGTLLEKLWRTGTDAADAGNECGSKKRRIEGNLIAGGDYDPKDGANYSECFNKNLGPKINNFALEAQKIQNPSNIFGIKNKIIKWVDNIDWSTINIQKFKNWLFDELSKIPIKKLKKWVKNQVKNSILNYLDNKKVEKEPSKKELMKRKLIEYNRYKNGQSR